MGPFLWDNDPMSNQPAPLPVDVWITVARRGWTGPFDAKGLDQEGDSVLLHAVPEVALTRAFLENGAHVHLNTQGRRETPLIRAVRHNHIDCVELLLEWGADVAPLDAYGVDALVYAVYCCPRAICLLMDHGADPHRPLGTVWQSALERANLLAQKSDPAAFIELQGVLALTEQSNLEGVLPASALSRPPGKKL